ncbi:hypothetical protein M0812_07005 [Anaeramoeba flamelloides]|uniref:Uncharacterized protein n=1 Tax=Anaeramoeba flamelloides TaxID=1746091 RepID=A0AAV8AB73_9EUKA|nr:hypothetical protein M0812_07005 [Anaeramoeba flamelloides]
MRQSKISIFLFFFLFYASLNCFDISKFSFFSQNWNVSSISEIRGDEIQQTPFLDFNLTLTLSDNATLEGSIFLKEDTLSDHRTEELESEETDEFHDEESEALIREYPVEITIKNKTLVQFQIWERSSTEPLFKISLNFTQIEKKIIFSEIEYLASPPNWDTNYKNIALINSGPYQFIFTLLNLQGDKKINFFFEKITIKTSLFKKYLPYGVLVILIIPRIILKKKQTAKEKKEMLERLKERKKQSQQKRQDQKNSSQKRISSSEKKNK